jgi:hypothetical protein
MIRNRNSGLIRIVASVGFLVYGAASIGLLWIIFIFLNMGSGMSAGPVIGVSVKSSPILWWAGLYFVASGIGVILSWRRELCGLQQHFLI